MNSFYTSVAGSVGETCPLTAEDARHACSVLRLRTGDALYCVDPEGRRFAAEIAEISAEGCAVRLMQLLPDNEAPVSITLYQGLPKADKLELVIQKSVELGAVRIVPTVTARSIARIDPRDSEKKTARWHKIAAEAAGQSGRGIIPTVEPPITLRAALPRLARENVLLCYEGGGAPLGDLVSPADESVSLLIGPEGGFAPAEVEAVAAGGGRLATLGTRILRCETAPLAALAILQEAARKK